MKIAVIAPTSLPARRANTIQVMKMTQALCSIEHEARLAVPGSTYQKAGAAEWGELARHYGLSKQFSIEWLPANDRFRRYDFSYRALRWARGWGAEVVYTRLPQAAALASRLGMPAVLEMHDLPGGRLGPLTFDLFLRSRGVLRLVVISKALLSDLSKKYPMSARPGFSIVAPDGVDLDRYKDLLDPEAARHALIERLGSPELPGFFSPGSFTAGYMGHFYPGRGAEVLFELAACAPDIAFLVAGGEPEDLPRLNTQAKQSGLHNIILTGFVPNAELPLYQAACDVLLMPYQRRIAASSGGDISRYLSPMKLFEYMASRRAILSSDLSVLREVISEVNAILLPPDDPNAWLAALRSLRDHPEVRTKLAEHAWQDVQKYSWEARAEAILAGLEANGAA